MKRLFTKILVVLATIALGVVVFWNVNFWRMYDAHWQPLAMTQAEAYCVGLALGEHNVQNIQDDKTVDACVATSKLDNTTPDLASVPLLACKALAETLAWPQEECLNAVEAADIWFLQHGGYTWEWNDSNKRPNASHSNIRDGRAGRSGAERNDEGRFTS